MLKRFMLLSFVLMLVLAACASPTPPPAPTAAPVPPPTQVPTRVPPTSAPEQPAAAFCDTIDPSQFNMNTLGLPYSWQANCVPATPYDKSQPPGPVGLPEHIQINFGVENPTNQQPGDPVIYIIPKQDYINLWTAAGDNTVADRMSQLEALVKNQGANMPSSGMPVLPMERAVATNDLAVQGKYLDLGRGAAFALWAVSARGRILSPAPIHSCSISSRASPEARTSISWRFSIPSPRPSCHLTPVVSRLKRCSG